MTEDIQFNDIQGFRDAMYGVYASMATTDMYGKNMSCDFLDKIGQMFIIDSDILTPYISDYKYTHANVRPIINEIWGKSYTTISYVNNIIAHAENTAIAHSDLPYIKGEAYALRAFLHYDVTRLFAENYRVKPDARGIPYAYTFDLKNKTLYSLKNTYRNILNDLTIAEKLLENDSYISSDAAGLSSDYRKNRYQHCNKFAVKAMKSRVYYSMGNADSAAFFAKQVIESTRNFELQDFTKFAAVKRYPAPMELIFGLNTTQLTDPVYQYFLGEAGISNKAAGRKDLPSLYDTKNFSVGNIDTRFGGYYKEESRFYQFIRFVENEAEKNANVVKGINLIRLPEIYYILAESTYNKDKQQAIDLLNKVRNSRGLKNIDPKTIETYELFEKELMQERMREMPGEGQVFFALKHYNRPFLKTDGKTTVEPSSEIFVLPWPQNELDFGMH